MRFFGVNDSRIQCTFIQLVHRKCVKKKGTKREKQSVRIKNKRQIKAIDKCIHKVHNIKRLHLARFWCYKSRLVVMLQRKWALFVGCDSVTILIWIPLESILSAQINVSFHLVNQASMSHINLQNTPNHFEIRNTLQQIWFWI